MHGVNDSNLINGDNLYTTWKLTIQVSSQFEYMRLLVLCVAAMSSTDQDEVWRLSSHLRSVAHVRMHWISFIKGDEGFCSASYRTPGFLRQHIRSSLKIKLYIIYIYSVK